MVGDRPGFLGDPEVIIVDEPTAGLDPLAELSIGKTVVLSTHIASDIEDSCYQVSVLDHGRTIYTGELPELAGFSRGKVWETVITSQQYEEFNENHQVLNVKANGNQVTVDLFIKSRAPVPKWLSLLWNSDIFVCLTVRTGKSPHRRTGVKWERRIW